MVIRENSGIEGNQPIVDVVSFLKFLTSFPSHNDHQVPLTFVVGKGIIY